MVFFRQRLALPLFIAIIAMAIAGCGQTTETPNAQAVTPVDDANTVTVIIENFKFHPADITIAPGTRVVFVNKDDTRHNIVEGSVDVVASTRHEPQFASPDLALDDTWEYVFEEEGFFDYACTIAGHYLAGMIGTITVQEGADNEAFATTVSAQAGAADHGTSHGPTTAVPDFVYDQPDQYVVKPEGIVEILPVKSEGNVKEFALDIQEITHEILDGVEVTAWAFNGILPGPTMRVQQGDTVRVHFTNTHNQPHTIHWHGIYADVIHDGVPHTSFAVMPGESWTYEFEVPEAGTFWYHCHVDSYRHVDMGMYGGIIVEPKDGKTWDHEYTFFLDDWDSTIEPLASPYDPDFDHWVVNGKAFPETPTITMPVDEVTRIRFINAGYNNFAMHLHGPSFTVVATDGRPLPVPYQKDTLDIAPGERYDIEVRPTKVGDYPFHVHNLRFVTNDLVYPGGMHFMVSIIDTDESDD